MLNPQTLSVKQSVNTTASFEMSSLADNIFTIMTDRRTQQGISITCIILTMFAIYMLCVAMHRNFKEKGLQPKAKEILSPLFMIALTFIHIRDIKDSMVNPKSTASIVETSPNKAVDKNNSQSAEEAQINFYLKSVSNRYLLDI
jgi:hypothetical protein